MSHLAKIQEALKFSENSDTLADITHIVLSGHKTDELLPAVQEDSGNKPLLSYAEYALFAQAIAPMANLEEELGRS